MTMRRLATWSAIVLAFCSIGCVALLRHRPSNAYPLGFLRWNLLLAWVPFALAVAAHLIGSARRRGALVGFIVLGAGWLVFLPNAPYVITDAVHLRQPGVLLPFDIAVIGAFAATAFGLGIVSLRLMHDAVEARAGRVTGWAFALATAAVAGVGVWIGRVWRWNSWDLIDAPGARLRELVAALLEARHHTTSITIVAGLAAMFLLAYVLLFAVTQPRRSAALAP